MKNGTRIAFVAGVVATLALYSCSKDYNTRICEKPSQVEYGFDTNMVNVRVINQTGYPLCNFVVDYRTDIDRPYDYGTLDIDKVTEFTRIEFTKAYPIVHFDLGTGHYTIVDSFMNAKYPYESININYPGFYNLYVSFIQPLDSLVVSANVYPDPELMTP